MLEIITAVKDAHKITATAKTAASGGTAQLLPAAHFLKVLGSTLFIRELICGHPFECYITGKIPYLVQSVLCR